MFNHDYKQLADIYVSFKVSIMNVLSIMCGKIQQQDQQLIRQIPFRYFICNIRCHTTHPIKIFNDQTTELIRLTKKKKNHQ